MLVLAAPSVAPAGGGYLVIKNARIVDGTGAPPREGATIVIRDGRIVAIGTDVREAADAEVLDAGGRTVLPGLIDSHVHFAAAPGGAFRGDSDATRRELNRQHLRAYLASGVTTVLEPGSPVATVREIEQLIAEGAPAPRYLTTGPMITVPGGYPGTDLHGPVDSPAEVEAKLDLIQSLGGVGVKIAIESLGGLEPYPPEIRDAILTGARKRGLPLYVHATAPQDQEAALDYGAHAIAHSTMGGHWMGQVLPPSDLSDEHARRMAESGAYQQTTFSILDAWPNHYDTARLNDPSVQLVVPELEIVTARDPDAQRYFFSELIGAQAAWTPTFLRPFLARMLFDKSNLDEGLQYSQRNVAKLYRAGVPIVAATDAPSIWPLAIYNFHGPQLAREVELLGEAGLPPADAIGAATRVPASMLGLDSEIGTIEVGKRADLVIVDGDPLRDLRALRAVHWTVKDGVAGTPREWMER
jgi:imidazolonepropionase-like amidohydrolase